MAASYGPHEHRFAGLSWFGTEGMKVSWGGVFAGVLVALGVAMLMAAIGAAIGVAPESAAPNARGAGASVWGELQRFVALFLGGMVATRTSAIVDRATLVCEGVLVWVVTFVIMAHIGAAGAAALTRGAFDVLAGTPAPSSVLGPAVDAAASPAPAAPPVDVSPGRLRSPELADKVAAVTGLSIAETRAMLAQTAERIEGQQRPAPADVEETARPRTQALDRALAAREENAESDSPRWHAWLAVASLIVSLVAAVTGALMGRVRATGAVTPLP